MVAPPGGDEGLHRIVGVTGAADEAAAGWWSLTLPAGLALLDFATADARPPGLS